MQHLYDEEIERIQKVGQDLQVKYNHILKRFDEVPFSKKNRQLLEVWHEEVVSRYRDIGWIVMCDITPALAGLSPPTIDLVDRVESHEFDFDKKKWEVLKSRESGGS